MIVGKHPVVNWTVDTRRMYYHIELEDRCLVVPFELAEDYGSVERAAPVDRGADAMSIAEIIGVVSGLAALLAALIAIWLDVKIIRELDPHHELIRELHHHTVAKSLQPGHEDCHGPVYRRGGELTVLEIEAMQNDQDAQL